ncbi:hypothetical protein C0Q70_15732 [Pomacea canaliculata]|uniref:Uncharacterized protein n=1 Tax=Pomacea canaliculata TaxID=400727 RepID=A0A2T7NVQ7_POMCA|nr:hypothetical protein C0Q70_15732 [Pomacea canaliculata]
MFSPVVSSGTVRGKTSNSISTARAPRLRRPPFVWRKGRSPSHAHDTPLGTLVAATAIRGALERGR